MHRYPNGHSMSVFVRPPAIQQGIAGNVGQDANFVKLSIQNMDTRCPYFVEYLRFVYFYQKRTSNVRF